jgi:uncharacterized NAD(P)/FAD-binding protein YdhS
MKSDGRAPVAIVGGGFSGTMLAAELARRGVPAILIDGSGRIGHGTAYSTSEPAHVLNVRAEGMSAWADDPEHFVRAFEAEGGDRRGFAERRLFGRYLKQILEEALATGSVDLVDAAAQKAEPDDDGWTLELSNGKRLSVGALVLANGNQEPEPLRVAQAAGDRFVNNPWGAEALAAIEQLAGSSDSALLIGTGLTMVDTVLSLDAAGHRGRIVALSRRGLIPRAHTDFDPSSVGLDQVPGGNVLALWRWLRRTGAQASWRAAVDSLRPHSHALWQGLGPDEQRRFLRHARPWWDVHRHRIAPEVAQTLHRLVGEGRLEIVAGRIVGMRAAPEGIEAAIRRRGRGDDTVMRFAYAFNCTGPLGAIERTRDPLLRGLLDEGLIRPDHLGIGLDVDEHSRASGSRRLWALGPLTKGRYWEIVAVPDIRVQAAQVAEDISRELGQ